MSNSLVRQSLTLLDQDNNQAKGKSKRSRTKSKGALDLIPINHRLISKQKNRKEFIPSERLSKVTVQQAKKELQLKKDYTSENVKKLLALSKSKLKIKDTDKLINRALRGKLKAKTKTKQKEKQPKEEATVFTEQDFEKFESEYFDE